MIISLVIGSSCAFFVFFQEAKRRLDVWQARGKKNKQTIFNKRINPTLELGMTEHHDISAEELKEKKRQSRRAAQRLHKELIDDESDVLSSVAAFVLYENEVNSLKSQR